jgi:hypothetical protein
MYELSYLLRFRTINAVVLESVDRASEALFRVAKF